VYHNTERGGKGLLDAPGYRFQALATGLPCATHSPLAAFMGKDSMPFSNCNAVENQPTFSSQSP
jgi:hypothetical protein